MTVVVQRLGDGVKTADVFGGWGGSSQGWSGSSQGWRIYADLDDELAARPFILVHGACSTGGDAVGADWATAHEVP